MASRRARVLVVDDERFFREAIRDALAPAGIEVVLAEDGGQALERAADPGVGAVVLDLQLPDMHGLAVFAKLKEQRPDLRVIILSAHTDQENVLEALRLGAFDYLAKPLHEEELSLAVRRALEAYGVAAGWNRLRGRVSRLEAVLEELSERARSEPPPPEEDLRQAAVQAAAEVLGAARTSLMLLDEDEAALRVRAAHGGKVDAADMDPVPVGEGVAGLALARSEPIVVADVAEDERFRARIREGRYATGSFAVAPLRAGARALGVLCACDPEGGDPFGSEDLALLRILGTQIAQMLEPGSAAVAAVEAEPTPRREEPPPGEDLEPGQGAAELARAVCEAVTAEVEPDRILRAVLRPVAERLGALPVSLYLLDPARRRLVREASLDGDRRPDRPELPPDQGLTGAVASSGQLVASDDPADDPRFDAAVDTPEDGAAGPLLCGALRFRGKTLGVFRAFPERPERAAPELGEVLSAALSAAVRNVLLYRSLVQTIEEVAAARREARGA